MARIKFLIFVLLGIGLAVAGLASLSERLGGLARTQVDERLAWGKVLLDASDRLAQAHRVRALEAAARDPSVIVAFASLSSVAPGAEGSGATALETVRKAATEALAELPGGVGGAALVIASNAAGSGAVPAEGGEARLLEDDPFGLGDEDPALEGRYARVDGTLYRVSIAAVQGADPVTGAPKVLGRIAAAFPLEQSWVAERAKDLTLGVTLVNGDQVYSSLPNAEREVAKNAATGPVALGPAPVLGPLVLPLFTDAPRAQALVVELPGVEGAKVVLTAPAATLASLAEFQHTALLGLAGLTALALAFLILIGSGASKAAKAEASASETAQAEPSGPTEFSDAASAEAVAAAPAEPLADTPLAAAPEPPAVTPDDFPFGDNAFRPDATQKSDAHQLPQEFFSMPPPPEPAAPAPAPAESAESFFASAPPAPEPAPAAEPAPTPAADPFAGVVAASPPGTATASAALDAVPLPPPQSQPQPQAGGVDPFGQVPGGGYQHEETTGSYRAMDPFALAAAQMDPSESQQYNERTVVAPVPEQLLRATGKKSPASADAVALPAPEAPAPAPAISPEEAHYLEVFQQFLATRIQCNEPAEGLNQERFVAKLRKNRDQLVEKYNCKTVRFQVYVKDGKAALKATPIKGA